MKHGNSWLDQQQTLVKGHYSIMLQGLLQGQVVCTGGFKEMRRQLDDASMCSAIDGPLQHRYGVEIGVDYPAPLPAREYARLHSYGECAHTGLHECVSCLAGRFSPRKGASCDLRELEAQPHLPFCTSILPGCCGPAFSSLLNQNIPSTPANKLPK